MWHSRAGKITTWTFYEYDQYCMTWNHLGMCQAVGYPQSGIQWASSKDTDKHERISQLVSIQTWYRSRPICESLWIHIHWEGLCMFAKWEQWVQSTTITVTCWTNSSARKGWVSGDLIRLRSKMFGFGSPTRKSWTAGWKGSAQGPNCCNTCAAISL